MGEFSIAIEDWSKGFVKQFLLTKTFSTKKIATSWTLFICNQFFYGFNQTMISLLDFFNHDFKTMVLWYYCKFRTAIVTLKIPVMGIHYCDFIWGILMGKSYGDVLWGFLKCL